MEDSNEGQYSDSDMPTCCVCGVICPDCTPSPLCSHLVCPACRAKDTPQTDHNACTVCLSEKAKKGSASKSRPGDILPFSSNSKEEDFAQVSLQDELKAASRTSDQKESNKEMAQEKEKNDKAANVPEKVRPNTSRTNQSLQQEVSHLDKSKCISAEEERAKEAKSSVEEGAQAEAVPRSSQQNGNEVLDRQLTAATQRKEVKPIGESPTEPAKLSEKVSRIHQAVVAATRYSHCSSCLKAKKSQAPDLVCLDCNVSFCRRCSTQHVQQHAATSNNNSAGPSNDSGMVPIEEGRNLSRQRSSSNKGSSPLDVDGRPKLLCSEHQGSELGLYCCNCEVLVCRECVVDRHIECPGIVSAYQYAQEEKEAIKSCRVQYAQVTRFFSEKRRDTEEILASLSQRRKELQTDIRAFFSTLIKACMDVEGTLLEQLETSISDHSDVLKDHSSDWLNLQESVQQLLDVTDVIHFLPTPEFLPLVDASKACLSRALREGETLAGSVPNEMSLELQLEVPIQRKIIRRIKDIGSAALTVNTHNTLTLRNVANIPLNASLDKDEPLVTGMELLTSTLIVVADFNNSCLKLITKDQQDHDWSIATALPLKWRPYAICKLSQLQVSMLLIKKPSSLADDISSLSEQPLTEPMTEGREGLSTEQSNNGNTQENIYIAVSSPFAGCFVVSIPLSGQQQMNVIQSISEDKNCWGLSALNDRTLALSAFESGQSFISLIDTQDTSKKRLPLICDTTLTPLITPRHITTTSPSSILVGDHGRKAVLHVTTTGKILFMYGGYVSQRLGRPEGLCMDSQGHMYIADSADNSISVITKGGHLYSKTGSKQSDLNCPQALCVDRNSNLYVANNGGKLLSIYDIIQLG